MKTLSINFYILQLEAWNKVKIVIPTKNRYLNLLNLWSKMESKKMLDIVNKVKKHFKCYICDSKLSSKAHLTRHIAHVHFAAVNEKRYSSNAKFVVKVIPTKVN